MIPFEAYWFWLADDVDEVNKEWSALREEIMDNETTLVTVLNFPDGWNADIRRPDGRLERVDRWRLRATARQVAAA